MGLSRKKRSFEEGETFAENFDEALDRFRAGEEGAIGELLEETQEREETLFRVLHPHFRPVETLQPGTRMDAYVIQRKVGVGGMGIVFEAIEDRTGRRVALKISRFEGKDSENQDRALQREMEALSRLAHPNIATLYRAGYFEQRYTFLAMEFIQGKNLRQHVREKRFPQNASGIKEVLKLFLQLVEAVAYIQSKGIQHLDLKPSNILVDEDGRVKLLDFGLSRLQHMGLEEEAHASDRTGESVPGDGVQKGRMGVKKITGTFPYLAPEQVMGNFGELSTRTDVYQLGFILYELLVGRRPVEYLEGRRKEMERQILREPVCPPRSLKKSIPRDLELVILKCLAKDPQDRYSGAAGLLLDLHAFLDGYPVRARPLTFWVFLEKFVQRNRRMVLLWTLLVGISVVLGGVSIVSLVGVRRAKEKAKGLERSLQITAKAIEDLGPSGRHGRAKVMASVLGGFSRALDQEVEKGGLLPEQEARLRAMLGRHYTKIGFHKKALPQLERALSLRRALYGPKPNGDLAQSLRDLAFLFHAMSRYDQSEPLHREALAMRLALFPAASRPVCQSEEELAELLIAMGRPKEALGLLREGLSRMEQSRGGGVYYLRQLRNLARLSMETGQVEKALVLMRNGKRVLEGNPQEFPAQEKFYFLRVFANVLAQSGRNEEALSLFKRLEAICSSVFGEESEEMVRLLWRETTISWAYLGKGEGLEKTKRAVRLGKKIFGENHAITLALRKNLARSLIREGLREEGKAELVSLMNVYRKGREVNEADRSRFLLFASSAFFDMGEIGEAQKVLEEVRDFFLQDGNVNLPLKIYFHDNWMYLLMHQKKYGRALAEGKKGLALVRRISAPRFGLRILGMMSLAHKALGHPRRAERFMEQRRMLSKRFRIPFNDLGGLFHEK